MMRAGNSVILCARQRTGSTPVFDDFLNVIGQERRDSELLYNRGVNIIGVPGIPSGHSVTKPKNALDDPRPARAPHSVSLECDLCRPLRLDCRRTVIYTCITAEWPVTHQECGRAPIVSSQMSQHWLDRQLTSPLG